ncbi:PEP-CTERM sorting domain-containing protein [Aeoliella mucimassa]|uniref:PEP-CTERM sorting domain-containing protein n=1 Tax=Aeoliella mucimassa TaxID=2527972 RepID=UPI0018D353BA|nr:PEP-CTERM sorting domain-containing protein [Aeoliella mucimassa]
MVIQRNIAPSGGSPGQSYDPASEGGPDFFSASSTDLLQGLMATYSGNDYAGGLTDSYPSPVGEVATGVSAWTDGAIIGRYPGDVDGDGVTSNDLDDFAVLHDGYGTIASGGYVTYDLGAPYDLTQIDVFLGWNDSGRDDASFNLQVAGPDMVFSTVETYTKTDNAGGGDPVTNYASISIDAPAAQYIQLEITDADNAYAGILEIDAFGTKSVPEPGTMVLLALGSVALVAVRCRK